VFRQPPKIAKTYDEHILASQQIIDACKKALNDAKQNENNIVVKGENGSVLFTRARQAITDLVSHHEDCVTILKKMRDNKTITSTEFEQVIQLYDVRKDINCFVYEKVSFSSKPQ
jgi:hypothetical protein